MATKKKVFNQGKEVRKLARERVGIVKPTVPIEPKDERREQKHKKPLRPDDPSTWESN